VALAEGEADTAVALAEGEADTAVALTEGEADTAVALTEGEADTAVALTEGDEVDAGRGRAALLRTSKPIALRGGRRAALRAPWHREAGRIASVG